MEPLPGFEGLVGQSSAMQALFARIRRVAPYDVPVLILGETGTEKELVARALHRLSRRRAGPFEALTCAALTPDEVWHRLLHADRLDARRGGTLSLDEIGDLAPDVQAQVGQLARLPSGADARLAATTQQDLLAAVRAGRFRADLYYALRRAVLVVPPLRDRLDDLPLLVEHVRRTVNARHGVAIGGVAAEALASLADYPWPGNVRELAAVHEEAMLLQREGWLRADHLGRVESRAPSGPPARSGPSPALARAVREGLALDLAAEPGGVATGRFARASSRSLAQARRDLGALVRQGRLRRVGRGRAAHYVVA
jgi:DNA-binding NtrC family response regulator